MPTAADQLASFARDACARGWAAATSGNFSVVASRAPLRLLITASGLDKRTLSAADLVEVDASGEPIADGAARPSAETPIHLAVARARDAGAVAHVHTVWATLASERWAAAGEVVVSGIEMLKALSGVATHAHRESIPVIENTQDWLAAAPAVEALLRERPDAHGLLIRGHGLYTWGRDLEETWRHLEAFDFLLEVVTRMEAR